MLFFPGAILILGGHPREKNYYLNLAGMISVSLLIFHFFLLGSIVIPADTFDSKSKFLDKTRKAFGGGNLNLVEVSANDLENYVSFLKESYYQGPTTQFFRADCIGMQSDDYWCLSNEVRRELWTQNETAWCSTSWKCGGVEGWRVGESCGCRKSFQLFIISIVLLFFLLFPCILYVEKPVWSIFASFLGSPSQRCTVTRNDFSASPTVKNV